MLKYFLPTLTFLVTIFSCNTQESSDLPELPTDPAILSAMERGQELLRINCESCHHPSDSLGGRLAPPMVAVKDHYVDDTTTLESFTRDFTRSVQKPNPNYAKMPGAIRRFGLMPALPLPEDQLADIATYVYYAKMESPEWLKEHQRQERKRMGHGKGKGHQAPTDTLSPAARGRQYALATKAQLGKNLLGAIQKGGAAYAVDFCNTRAIPLTDSMAAVQGVNIRRISDRPRNPGNSATETERGIIDEIRADLQAGKQGPHRIVETDQQFIGYYPIVTNGMCLQCHGKKVEQVLPTTLAVLQERYPADQATGYAANELRGVWVVSMPK
jgi:mono/diheme cytochrome c family protein/cytochrome c553